MKTLFILPELYPHPGGGLATYYLDYLSKIKQFCEIEVLVGSTTEQGLDNVEWNGITISYLKPELYKKYLPQFSHFSSWPEIQGHLASAWALYEQADAGKGFDIIETTDWGWNYLPFALNGYSNLITRLHGSIGQIEHYDPRDNFALYAHLTRVLECDTLPLVPNLLTYSYNNQQFWEESLNKEVQHIYPIVALKKDEENTSLIDVPKHPYALVVGRIQAWKGAEVLCQALQVQDIGIPVYWMGRDTTYKTVSSSYSAYLSKKYPGIWGKKIIPIGPRPPEECKVWMQNAKFGIVPSTWDMFNLTITEWISQNKPLVCSKGAGGHSILENMPQNLIIEPNSPESLINGLIKAVNLSEANTISQTSAQMANFNRLCATDALINLNLTLYQSVLAKSNISIPITWKYDAYFPTDTYNKRTTQLDQWPLKELLTYVVPRLLSKKYF